MKLSRTAAAAIGVAVAASGLAIAAPASAATPNVTYVVAAQLGNGPATNPGWNLENGAVPTSSTSGLFSSAFPELYFSFAAPIAITGTALSDAADNTSFRVNDLSNATAEIYWTDPNGATHVFRADATGDSFADDDVDWNSNASVNGTSFATLEDFDAAFANDPTLDGSEIIAIGVYIDSPLGANFYVFTVNGAQYSFMPQPVSSAPTTLTVDAYGSTGITVTTTGFLPNETGIVVGLGNAGSGGQIGAVDADANGAISYTYVAPTPVAGDYRLTFFGSVSYPQQFDFAVTAAAAPAPALAATGANVELPLIAGGVLLLGGVALAVVGAKRRRTA